MDNSLHKTTSKNINSKRLYNELIGEIEHVIRAFGGEVCHDEGARSIIVELVQEALTTMTDLNKIIQWNVIFDKRNNTKENIDRNIMYLDITYVQRNCFNVSQIRYTLVNQ